MLTVCKIFFKFLVRLALLFIACNAGCCSCNKRHGIRHVRISSPSVFWESLQVISCASKIAILTHGLLVHCYQQWVFAKKNICWIFILYSLDKEIEFASCWWRFALFERCLFVVNRSSTKWQNIVMKFSEIICWNDHWISCRYSVLLTFKYFRYWCQFGVAVTVLGAST